MEAAIAVIISAIVSALVSRQVAQYQLRIETSQQFSIIHFQERLPKYTVLYAYLSDFIKILEFGKLSSNHQLDKSITKKDIFDLYRNIEEWDSASGILLTDYAGAVCSEFRSKLYKLLENSEDEIMHYMHYFDEQVNRKIWINLSQSLEATIKNEIGIYAVKPFPGNTDFKPISNYDDARKISMGEKNNITDRFISSSKKREIDE